MKISSAQPEITTHHKYADNCDLLASTKDGLCRMMGETTAELDARGLVWKKEEIEFMEYGHDYEEVGDFDLEQGGRSCMVRDVKTLKGTGALITNEADSMGALKFRMSQVDRPSWADMKFLPKRGHIGGGHNRDIELLFRHVSSAHARDGAGPRSWLTRFMGGRAETRRSSVLGAGPATRF